MEDHDDYAFEPVPGLPERLPQGEALLWQGSPDWRALAVSAFHVRKVAVYFGILLAWQLTVTYQAGATASSMVATATWIAGVGAVAIALLCLLARLYARGTIYSLTSKRIVIRSGLALPVTLNLPLSLIESASLRGETRGTGSLALMVSKPNRVAWLVLWPNARPWHFNNPQPMLRCLEDAAAVAPMLASALEADAGTGRPRLAIRPAADAPEGASIGATPVAA